MEDQKIVKNRRQVVFTLADGNIVEGKVFLSLYEGRHERPQRVGELLNSDDAFVPVETTTGTLHLNIINIVAAQTLFMEEGDELMRLGKQYRVQIATSLGTVIEGQVFVNLPHERSRVSDYLNQRERFCRVLHADEIIYVGSRFILSVQD